MPLALPIALHVLAAVIWVGGMLAMLLVVRPTAVALLEPPLRLQFMAAALGRFFPWVWASVVLLPLTGYWLLFSAVSSLAQAPLYIQLMQWLGWPMIGLFLWINRVCYQRMLRNLAEQRLPQAAAALEQVRKLVSINALLGVVLIGIAVSGRYWV